jgi:hypothetical protein
MFDDHIREAREHLLRIQERVARDAVAQQQMLTAKLASTRLSEYGQRVLDAVIAQQAEHRCGS